MTSYAALSQVTLSRAFCRDANQFAAMTLCLAHPLRDVPRKGEGESVCISAELCTSHYFPSPIDDIVAQGIWTRFLRP
jgi:hypothetical protein